MKKIFYLFILLILFNIIVLTYPKLYSSHSLVYELNDDIILYEKMSEEQTTIASLTKSSPEDYDKESFFIKYEGLKELSYKNNQDSKIGTITYYYDGEDIEKEDITLSETINISYKKIFKQYRIPIYLGIILIIVIIFFIIVRPKKKLK